jgi:cysteine desulfurase
MAETDAFAGRADELQQRLEAGLRAIRPDTVVFGEGARRLPNTSCLRFGTLDAEQVLGRLERAGIVASSGAACTASGTQPSHVLLAMGESALHAKASVRLSLGRDTSADDIDRAIAAALQAIGPLLASALEPAEPLAV